MLVNNVKTTYPEPHIVVREDKRRDWSEISVFVDPSAPRITKTCAAIITHPCAGAKWFVYDNFTGRRGVPFKTRKDALWAAIEAAKNTDAYKAHTK